MSQQLTAAAVVAVGTTRLAERVVPVAGVLEVPVRTERLGLQTQAAVVVEPVEVTAETGQAPMAAPALSSSELPHDCFPMRPATLRLHTSILHP